MKKYLLLSTVLLSFSLVFSLSSMSVNATKVTYTVASNSVPFNGKMVDYSTYNSHTRHYYVLRSYLEELEKKGGGTLILNKGIYTISNTLYVPSNVTIIFKDGVTLNKGTITGTTQFTAAKSIFQLVRPSRANSTGVYGGYNGEKNISFIGEGNVTINMNYLIDGIAIIAGHNQNVLVDNIDFKNMYSGHFLEVDATQNMVIKNSSFSGSYASTYKSKEAINLDTPDRATEGWSQIWSKFDKTPNNKVVIEKNVFYNLDRAIGTHKYSEGKYHNDIIIRNNVIDKMRTDGIQVLNWTNTIIENNIVKNIPNGTSRAILVNGAKNPTIRNNQFENVPRPIQFVPWKNTEAGSKYATTYNQLNAKNITDLKSNSIKNGIEGFIRSYNILNEYNKGFEVFPLKVLSLQGENLKANPLASKTLYVSNTKAKAYKTTHKAGEYYQQFEVGAKLNLYNLGNNWYYGYMSSNNNLVNAFFHEDEVQGSKPFMGKSLYVSPGGAKAYQTNNKLKGIYTTYPAAQKLTLEYMGNYWYFGYVTHNGKSTKAYFHEDEVQGSKPFNGKTLYASPGGAKAYQTMNKTSGIYITYPIAHTLILEYVSNNWYFTSIPYNGKTVIAYFHEDEVQGSKPFIGRTLYVSPGGAKAYQTNNKSKGTYTSYTIAQKLTLEYIGNFWYHGYITHNGKTTKAFFHEDEVQGSKPFVGKTLYASPGGAKAYQTMNKTNDIYAAYPVAHTLILEYVSNNWYFASISYNGKMVNAYFHEDEVQGNKPASNR